MIDYQSHRWHTSLKTLRDYPLPNDELMKRVQSAVDYGILAKMDRRLIVGIIINRLRLEENVAFALRRVLHEVLELTPPARKKSAQ